MRKTKVFTVGGTMQRVVTGYNKGEVLASSITAMMLAASSGGIGYLQMGIPADVAGDATQAFQLGAATSTAPGGAFSHQVAHPAWGERIDMTEVLVDGAHNGDKVLVSWWEIVK